MSALLSALLGGEFAKNSERLSNIKVEATSKDSVLVSFDDDGKEGRGVLSVQAANPRMSWAAGSHTVGLRTGEGAQPVFSCTDTRLVERLFASVVPEIRSGDVRIMGIVRKTGMRTKIAVASVRDGLDAVGALVGRGHNRVDYVKTCLGGEQVDVIAYHPDPAVFLSNALQPAAVTDVVIDEDKEVGSAKAPRHQMAAAVGQGGLNSSLAGALLGLASVTITAA